MFVFYEEKLSRKGHSQTKLLKSSPRIRSLSSSYYVPSSMQWETAPGGPCAAAPQQRPHF